MRRWKRASSARFQAETLDAGELDQEMTEDESSAEVRDDTKNLCAMIGYSSFEDFKKADKGNCKAQKCKNAYPASEKDTSLKFSKCINSRMCGYDEKDQRMTILMNA